MSLFKLLPDAAAVLNLEPEEVAGVLLEQLHGRMHQRGKNEFHISQILHETAFEGFPDDRVPEIRAVFVEGWQWLEREGLLVPVPGNHDWMMLSRRGRAMKSRGNLQNYRHAQLLPRNQLHPIIATKVYSAFLRGDYDTAVFQAFKEVEVAVRTSSNLAPTDFGVPLMRKAFHTQTGPLRDDSRPEAERQGMLELFTGAIGMFKNPHSHRNVPLTDPVEAVEMIVLASHLLRIIDGRVGPSMEQ